MRYGGIMIGVTFLLVVAFGGATIVEGPVWASPPTPELAEREQRSCVTCHTALGRAELNEAGRYYREHGSFEDYPGELPPRRSESGPQPETPGAPAPPESPEEPPPN